MAEPENSNGIISGIFDAFWQGEKTVKRLLLIGRNTIKEGLRKKFLLGLLILCFVILALGLLLGQLSLDEQDRLTVDFGLVAVEITLSVLAVLLGSAFISGDLENKTLWAVLSRPVRPSVFFLGRYMGMAGLVCVALCALSLILFAFFLFLDISITWAVFQALFGFFFQSLLILAFVLFFYNFSTAFLVPFYCFGVFIAGHWMDSLKFFTEKSAGFFGDLFSYALYLFPNLERGNWKSAVVYGDSISFGVFLGSLLYLFLWTGAVLGFSLFLFERRDFP